MGFFEDLGRTVLGTRRIATDEEIETFNQTRDDAIARTLRGQPIATLRNEDDSRREVSTAEERDQLAAIIAGRNPYTSSVSASVGAALGAAAGNTNPPQQETGSETSTTNGGGTQSGQDAPTPQGTPINEETFKSSETRQDLVQSNIPNVAFSSTRQDNASFNINRFRAEVINSDSILPTHSYLVVFAPFKNIIRQSLTNQQITEENNTPLSLSQRVTMRCDSVILPNIGLLQEQNIRRYGYGPVENVAYGVNSGDITMQFIVDDKSDIIYFFENWFNNIVNRYSKGGADMRSQNQNGFAPYEVGYKDDYSCPVINVFVYDRSSKTVFEYDIFDAFPVNLQSINLSWADENSMMKINVTFAFTDFKIVTPRGSVRENALAAANDAIRNRSINVFEERTPAEQQEYEASINRGIQELVSTLPNVTFGPDNLPQPVSSSPLTSASTVQIPSITAVTPSGQTTSLPTIPPTN